MAKNTGRGSRVAQLDPTRHAFIDAKTQGGTFRGVRRARRNPLRRLVTSIEFNPFTAFVLFAVLNIAFQVITFATGVAHYEMRSLFDYTYTFDLGGFHYRYSNGVGFYGN